MGDVSRNVAKGITAKQIRDICDKASTYAYAECVSMYPRMGALTLCVPPQMQTYWACVEEFEKMSRITGNSQGRPH